MLASNSDTPGTSLSSSHGACHPSSAKIRFCKQARGINGCLVVVRCGPITSVRGLVFVNEIVNEDWRQHPRQNCPPIVVSVPEQRRRRSLCLIGFSAAPPTVLRKRRASVICWRHLFGLVPQNTATTEETHASSSARILSASASQCTSSACAVTSLSLPPESISRYKLTNSALLVRHCRAAQSIKFAQRGRPDPPTFVQAACQAKLCAVRA